MTLPDLRSCRLGRCPVCRGRSAFLQVGDNVREGWTCVRCRTIPRQRALLSVLERVAPGWRTQDLHESSPDGALSALLARECPRYVASQFFPDVASGVLVGGVRREDVQAQTFADSSLDVVITQDVFEHVDDPRAGFTEILRTLRPSGVHVFTIPVLRIPSTRRRNERTPDGLVHHLPAEYHGNPLGGGSLVVTDWGDDTLELVESWTGVPLERHDEGGAAWAAGRTWPVFVHRRPA